MKEERYIIVGIDPGTTTGLGFVDIDGNIIKVLSARNLGVNEIITEICAVGTAAIVSTDKRRTPPLVNKVSSVLGARLFTPNLDLSVEKKRELVNKWRCGNDHERDSLAAAIYAYYHFQNKLRRVEKQIKEKTDKIKWRVIRGEKVSDIISLENEGKGDEEKSRLRSEISALRKRNRELEEELENLIATRPKPPHRILELAAREAKKLMRDLWRGNLVILQEVPSLKFADLRRGGIRRGDIIVCKSREKDGRGVRFLEDKGVGCIIAPTRIESVLPTCKLQDIHIISWEGILFANPKEIEEKSHGKREINLKALQEILREYREQRDKD